MSDGGQRPFSSGFTLVELLVVISIIVVLLALLTPAMDRAIYRAELTVCAARQRAIASAAMQYAANHRRQYPYREVIRKNAGQPSRFVSALPAAPTNRFDDRDILDGYLTYSYYNEPLVGDVDYALSDDDTNLFIGYSVWFGFQFRALGYRGMFRQGDRLEYIPVSEAPRTPRYFRVVVSDIDFARPTASPPNVYSGHPDEEGYTARAVRMNGATTKQTNSWWFGNTNNHRGAVDFNYTYDDASVVMLEDVGWDEAARQERMLTVAEHSNLTNEVPDYNQLPRE